MRESPSQCPRCGSTEFHEIDCGPDSYEDDIFYISYKCKACGLWYSGWSDKWLIDVEYWPDEEDATEFTVLFQLGDFVLHSGQRSDFKIDCDALTDADLDCLCYLLSERLPSFGSVEGVPTGGCRIADKMHQYVSHGPLLIVDDVWTTGGSLIEYRGDREAIGAVLFARSEVPYWVVPLFCLTEARSGLADCPSQRTIAF